MQDEETSVKEPETEAPEEVKEGAEAEEPKHDAVAPGGKCRLCGWTFGDPVKGIDPHIVIFGSSRNEPDAPPEPKKFVGKEPDPNACEAISPYAKCPKCGWSGTDPATKDNPHPVLL